MLVTDFLVHTVQVADLAPAHTDITRGDVTIRADMAVEFAHEGVAEAHHFAVALAFGVKIGTAFTAAHRQGGQRILEDLLEAEEFDDPQIHRGVEAQPAFVGSDRVVELHAEPAVDLHIAVVIFPGHTEHHYPVGFDNPFVNLGLDELRMLGNGRFEGGQHLFDGLMELRLCWVLLFGFCDNFLYDGHFDSLFCVKIE